MGSQIELASQGFESSFEKAKGERKEKCEVSKLVKDSWRALNRVSLILAPACHVYGCK